MRILGGHDYYDTALGFGRDETLVFVRTPADKAELVPFRQVPLRLPRSHTLNLGEGPFMRVSTATRSGVDYTFYPTIIWFAGTRHGGFRVTRYDHRLMPADTYAERNETLWIWNCDRLFDFMEQIGVELKKPRRGDEGESINITNLEAFFTDPGRREERAWLIENRHSIAVHHTDKWQSESGCGWKFDTDGLKDRHLQKLLDPFEAFQSLSQWLGGVLPRSANPMISINDEKTMVAKHGMDEWSFRRMPQRR